MSAAKQTAELVERLKREGRVITDKRQAAEIRARCEAHDIEAPEHLLSDSVAPHEFLKTVDGNEMLKARLAEMGLSPAQILKSQHRNTNTKDGAEDVG